MMIAPQDRKSDIMTDQGLPRSPPDTERIRNQPSSVNMTSAVEQ